MDTRNLDSFALQFSNRDKLKEGYWLNNLLDQLNALDFRTISFPDNSKKMTYILTECLSVVDPKETFLVAKCCQLLRTHAANVPLEPLLLQLAVPWCLQALQRCGDIALLDILQALETVIRLCGDKLQEQVVGDIVVSLGQELEGRASLTSPADVQVWRVQCLSAAAHTVTATHRTLYVNTLLTLLERQPQLDSEADAQVVKCVVEGLEVVGGTDPGWLAGHLGEVLGVVMAYLHYGLEGWQPQVPTKLLPLPGAQWEPPPIPATANKGGGKTKRRQKKRVSNIEVQEDDEREVTMASSGGPAPPPPLAPWLTSDSDMSDSEGGRLRRVRSTQARVRVATINLLVQVIKSVDIRELFGYYSSVVGGQGLCHSVVGETSARLSGVAASTLGYMLAMAKPYFTHAQHSTVTSYTPFSSVLASLLDTVHHTLACPPSPSPSSVPLLQCATCLVDVSPYHRLRPGLLPPLLRSAIPLLNHKEVVVSVAALTLLGAVVSVEPCPDDVRQLLTSPSPPWVLTSALQYFKEEEVRAVSLPVRVEWWQVTSGLVRHHWAAVRPHTMSLVDAVLTDVASRLDLVRLHAVRTLQHLVATLATDTEGEGDCVVVWERALCSELLALVGVSPSLAAATCDCLGVMSPVTFQHLSDKLQIWCLTTLLGCARDEEATVRTAALQALAAFVTFPTLSQDDQFVGDVSEVVCTLLRDPVPLVSGKAAWALGNITDMLYKSQHGEEVIPPLRLIKASVEAAQGKLKVRANGVRALGNLMGLLSASHLSQPEYREVMQQAATVLVANATSTTNMKVSWNACYALGSMLRNTALHEASSSWQEVVLSALCSLVVRSPNYKVRTNACGALAAVSSRSHYGSHYLAAWRAALQGLQNANDTNDFREVRHQDSFLQQLCLTLCHLASLVEPSDLSLLHEELVYQLDTVQQHLSHFVSCVVPERTDAVLQTATHLTSLATTTSGQLNLTQSATLTMLSDTFTFNV